MAHISSLSAPHFVATKSPAEIVTRLREDEALMIAHKPCSWVAYHLPEYQIEQGEAVASHLARNTNLGHDIKCLIYETLTAVIQRDTPAETIVSWLEERVAPQASASNYPDAPNILKPPPIILKRLWHIFRLAITNSYSYHPSMCISCGAFNHSFSLLSMPSRLFLPYIFTALVTGARINLGYYTTLHLLRCGARVTATTRYPRDAAARYLEEADSVNGTRYRTWGNACSIDYGNESSIYAGNSGNRITDRKERLRVLGADFRRQSRVCNNAAQTLTDSVKKERATKRENMLEKGTRNEGLLIEGAYKARVREGSVPMVLEAANNAMVSPDDVERKIDFAGTVDILQSRTGETEPYSKSSWVQSIREIPYKDLISAHFVNTFTPFILCSELLPLMGCPDPKSTKTQGCIIKVSSREGIFEGRLNSSTKKGKYVHTNMSKAALNMITETEADPAWHSRRVAMNTVDLGYIIATLEHEDANDGIRPIGWEDGAGRVLWPVAIGNVEGRVVRGRSLKHYGAMEVDPGARRG
ncbi:hypothetical protein EJ02DRAFT_508729 [Clathrospora elynae]|uniref:NAD(P)-binding protein n=1 Tax=Clathrospora elynae TaxID=706981 RepID=A0A6A5T3R1_9PLEO|nr:hypothetical protein EJ02DRAFT_508729 [Clathrospora elynae]